MAGSDSSGRRSEDPLPGPGHRSARHSLSTETIVSLWLAPSGVNGASSKLCPAHFRHVETVISDSNFPPSFIFDIIHQGRSPANRRGATSGGWRKAVYSRHMDVG